MIIKYPIARDDIWYLAWPDVALHAGNRLVCVFASCSHHGNRDRTQIMCTNSDDRGQTWSAPQAITAETRGDPQTVPYWNCPRITALADGRMLVVVDRITQDGAGVADNVLITSVDGGRTWGAPAAIPVEGIVHGPHAGRWLVSAHARADAQWRSQQRVWWSDDQGATWQGPAVIARSAELWHCEGSILELPGGELACFLRENSCTGIDCHVALSRDSGLTWGEPWRFPLPGCHRPVAGLLDTGEVLITHRFLQGGQGWIGWWTQNTFVALTDTTSVLAGERCRAHTRIMPLDFDRSPQSDCGYTGWVQFADGGIYVVNYCVDDWHRGQIRGYSFRREDLLLP
jgi:BNR repeat-like domain